MHDPDLERLLQAMDAMVDCADRRQDGGELAVEAELERISMRLECIARRLGDAAQESAYLKFIRRSLASSRGEAALAASA